MYQNKVTLIGFLGNFIAQAMHTASNLMVLPQYREGDSTFSGRNIADIVESGRMEVRAKVTEIDRDNLQAGQPGVVQVDALPGRSFNAKVGPLSGPHITEVASAYA